MPKLITDENYDAYKKCFVTEYFLYFRGQKLALECPKNQQNGCYTILHILNTNEFGYVVPGNTANYQIISKEKEEFYIRNGVVNAVASVLVKDDFYKIDVFKENDVYEVCRRQG